MILNRRDFARIASLATASRLPLPAPAFANTPSHPSGVQSYGVQLYSIRQLAALNLPSALQHIRAIGYTQVEFFWQQYTVPAKQLRTMVQDAGLTAPSGLFHFAELESRIPYASDLGLTYMVCPEIPKQYTASPQAMQRAGAEFNRIGENVRSAGMHLAFHNANPEFAPFHHTNLFTLLMDNTDPHLLGLEIDCYWAIQAGQDVLSMLNKYRDRIHLLHLKDRTASAHTSYIQEPPPGHFADVGSGTIAWRPILEQARAQGIRYFFVDQDGSPNPPLQSLQASFTYLHSLNL
ncbi:MAG: sugar phosphate isomerase/epimerase [Acidobacteria bacterium]|nr:sugar phosphate isomerase/epimerase [Acidobacteriota bacterium]